MASKRSGDMVKDRGLRPILEGLDEHTREHVQETLELAARLYSNAQTRRTRHERALDNERAGMVRDEHGKETLVQMMDQAFRSKNANTTADQMAHILNERGIPGCFSRMERFGLWLLRLLVVWLPGFFVPIVKAVMRKKTEEVILPGELGKLVGHVRSRKADDIQLNVNNLGEMILGEDEARRKTEDDVRLLADPSIECISVKASNLYSQVSALGHAQSVRMMMERIRPRLRAAKANKRQGYDPMKAERWDRGYKQVNLDMEEYRDMAITLEAFRRVLDEKEFLDMQAGLAIQSYIPDSYGAVVELLEWAKGRVARGGAPIRIRVVKGANRAMELVESSVKGIKGPTYDDKIDSDACWKKIVELISRPGNINVCHLGIATHNVFDMCWAALLVKRRGVERFCVYEMLEGMVNHVHRAVQKELGTVLLYAPAVKKEKFLTAVAYLVRRFDELTDPNNFLSHVFGVMPGSPEWEHLAGIFVKSVRRMESVSCERRRTQNRLTETHYLEPPASLDEFRNEPDTDWTASANRVWLVREVIGRMRFITAGQDSAARIPAPKGTRNVPADARKIVCVYDRSHTDRPIAEVELATLEDADDYLNIARGAAARWADYSIEKRSEILARVTAEFRSQRAELIALGALDVGKAFDQTDGEVSEAVDFGVMYPLSARHFHETLPNVKMKPLGGGVVMVISPWNFPVAIPAGGVFAALAAGNAVILKPASASRVATSIIAECFWVCPELRDVLQVVICESSVAAEMVKDPRVDGVILTGGTDTADRILRSRPGLHLCAETGGKNVTIVTGKADRELAIKHIAVSAFSNNGQKCSATSLVLLTPDVYDDPEFMSQFRDAVQSLNVGYPWFSSSVITPLYDEPGEDLHRGLTVLDEGEEWLLEPHRVKERKDFWTPGIRIGTKRGNFTHKTELFGPSISVMRIADLEEAMEVMRETGMGLTFGIESLDEREVQYAIDHAEAGVLYCNRNTVGAIVHRQTFGGWKDSRRGPGIHAGGLNYVTNFMSYEEPDGEEGDPKVGPVSPEEIAATSNAETCFRTLGIAENVVDELSQFLYGKDDRNVSVALRSIVDQWVHFFSKEHLPAQKIRGEDNVHRYRPLGKVIIRVTELDSVFDIVVRIVAATVAGNTVTVSFEPDDVLGVVMSNLSSEAFQQLSLLDGIEWAEESDGGLIDRIRKGGIASVRYAHPDRVPEAVHIAAADIGGVYVCSRPVLRTARLELLNYIQEQTVANVYHRYGGNLRDEDNK